MIRKNIPALFTTALCLLCGISNTYGQNLEPRAYSNAPVGMNFLLAGYRYSAGALEFDPALPVEDADAAVNIALFAYVRTMDIAGKSAKAGILLPYAGLSADGYLSGEYKQREDAGIADPAFYFTVNLSGAPALSFKEFKGYQQDTIVGLTFKLTAPLGVYDSDKLLNIGTNRWSFEPEIGISQALGNWTLEGSAAVTLYADNDDFDNGKTREQDPIYNAQGHVIYSFRKGIWLAVGVTYFTGGRSEVDGVVKNDLQQNWRGGFTFTMPINRNHSIKLFGSSGVSTRTGSDYDSLGIAWQHAWGKGF